MKPATGEAASLCIPASSDETACEVNDQNVEQWCYDGHDSWVESTAVAPDGAVYTSGLDDTACGLDREGVLEFWCYGEHTNGVRDITTDPSAVGAFVDQW